MPDRDRDQLLTEPSPMSSLREITEAMMDLATSRQAEISVEVLSAYTRKLTAYDPRDVLRALDELGDEPREMGQTAFPDRGTVLRRVREVEAERKSRERRAEGRKMVCWRCVCGASMSGFLRARESRSKRCPVCAETMEITVDDAL